MEHPNRSSITSSNLTIYLVASEIFLKSAWEKALWKLLWGPLFLISLGTLGVFVTSITGTYLRIEQIESKAHAEMNEMPAIRTLMGEVDKCLELFIQSKAELAKLQQRARSGEIVSKTDALTGYLVLKISKAKLTKTLGEVRGSTFQNAGISAVLKHTEGILMSATAMLPELEASYSLYFQAKTERIGSRAFATPDSQPLIQKTAEFMAQVESLRRQSPRIVKDYEVEVSHGIAEIYGAVWSILLAPIAWSYALVFCTVVVIRIQALWPQAIQKCYDERASIQANKPIGTVGDECHRTPTSTPPENE